MFESRYRINANDVPERGGSAFRIAVSDERHDASNSASIAEKVSDALRAEVATLHKELTRKNLDLHILQEELDSSKDTIATLEAQVRSQEDLLNEYRVERAALEQKVAEASSEAARTTKLATTFRPGGYSTLSASDAHTSAAYRSDSPPAAAGDSPAFTDSRRRKDSHIVAINANHSVMPMPHQERGVWEMERRQLCLQIDTLREEGQDGIRRIQGQMRYLRDEQLIALTRLEAKGRDVLVDLYQGSVVALEKALQDSILSLLIAEYRGTVRAQQHVEAAITKERAEGIERADFTEAKHKATMQLFIQQLYTPVFRHAMAQPAARAQITTVQRQRYQMEATVADLEESQAFFRAFMSHYLEGARQLMGSHHRRSLDFFSESVAAANTGRSTSMDSRLRSAVVVRGPTPIPLNQRLQADSPHRRPGTQPVRSTLQFQSTPEPSSSLLEPQRRGLASTSGSSSRAGHYTNDGSAPSLPRISAMARAGDSGLNDEYWDEEGVAADGMAGNTSTTLHGYVGTPVPNWPQRSGSFAVNHPPSQHYVPAQPVNTFTTRQLLSSTAFSAHLFLSDTLLQEHRDQCLGYQSELLHLRSVDFEKEMAKRWAVGAGVALTAQQPTSASIKNQQTMRALQWLPMPPTLSLDLSPFARSGLVADQCLAMYASLERVQNQSILASGSVDDSSGHLVGLSTVKPMAAAVSISALWLELHAEAARGLLDDFRDLLGRLHNWLPHRPNSLSQKYISLPSPTAHVVGHTSEKPSKVEASRGGSRLQNQAQDGALTILEAQRDQAAVVSEWLRQEVAAASKAIKAVIGAHGKEAIEAERDMAEDKKRLQVSAHSTGLASTASVAANAKHSGRGAASARLLLPTGHYNSIRGADSAADFMRILEASELGYTLSGSEGHAALRNFDDGELLTPSVRLALPPDAAGLVVDKSTLPPVAYEHLDGSDSYNSVHINTRRLQPIPSGMKGNHPQALANASHITSDHGGASTLYYFDFEGHCNKMKGALAMEEDNIKQIAAAQAELAAMTKQLGATADDYAGTMKQVSIEVTQHRDRLAAEFVDLTLQLEVERSAHAKTLAMHISERAELKEMLLHMTVLAGEFRQLCHDGRDSLGIVSLSSSNGNTDKVVGSADPSEVDPYYGRLTHTTPGNHQKALPSGSYYVKYTGDWLDSSLSFWEDGTHESGLVAAPRAGRRVTFGSSNTRPYSKHRLGHRLISAMASEVALEQHICLGSALLYSYTASLVALKAAFHEAKVGVTTTLSNRLSATVSHKRHQEAEALTVSVSLLRDHALTAMSEAAIAHQGLFAEANIHLVAMAQHMLGTRATLEGKSQSLQRELESLKKEAEAHKGQTAALLHTVKDKDQRIVLLSAQTSKLTEAGWVNGNEIASLRAEVDLRSARIADLEQRLEMLQSVLNTEVEATTKAMKAQHDSLRERASAQDMAARLSDAKKAVSSERERDQQSHRRTLQYLIDASGFAESMGNEPNVTFKATAAAARHPLQNKSEVTEPERLRYTASPHQSPIPLAAHERSRVWDDTPPPMPAGHIRAYSATRHPSPLR